LFDVRVAMGFSLIMVDTTGDVGRIENDLFDGYLFAVDDADDMPAELIAR
jgi:hypothetical protein